VGVFVLVEVVGVIQESDAPTKGIRPSLDHRRGDFAGLSLSGYLAHSLYSSIELPQEFTKIELGNWAGKDLRKMSEEIGLKNIYDKYYGWPSSFVHGQWAAVRNSAFDLCLNPLHRLHRLPGALLGNMEDVAADGIKLTNLLLDLVNEAYPSFRPRLRASKSPADSAGGDGAGNDPIAEADEESLA
jgi:uncharacterized protein DUF5677